MTCDPVPQQESGQFPINHVLEATPYSPSWWVTQNITDIPGDSVGWLVAQGWQITDITYDNTTGSTDSLLRDDAGIAPELDHSPVAFGNRI